MNKTGEKQPWQTIHVLKGHRGTLNVISCLGLIINCWPTKINDMHTSDSNFSLCARKTVCIHFADSRQSDGQTKKKDKKITTLAKNSAENFPNDVPCSGVLSSCILCRQFRFSAKFSVFKLFLAIVQRCTHLFRITGAIYEHAKYYLCNITVSTISWINTERKFSRSASCVCVQNEKRIKNLTQITAA